MHNRTAPFYFTEEFPVPNPEPFTLDIAPARAYKLYDPSQDIDNKELHIIPSTRFQGSKRRILPWLYSIFTNIRFDNVLDAFGGSTCVSYLLKRMDKTVTFNDNLRWNYILGQAVIANNHVTLNNQDMARLLAPRADYPWGRVVSTHFKDIYYLDSENEWIETVTTNILTLTGYSQEILRYKRALAFYALFQACLVKRPFNLFHRRNLDVRLRNVSRSFGNKTSWDTPFVDWFRRFVMEANSLVFDSPKRSSAINRDAFDIDPSGFDLVYLDPPYIKKTPDRETTNYLRYYHFLEGLATYRTWERRIDFTTSNRRLKDNQCQPSFIPDEATASFDQLFQHFSSLKIVLSYKAGGIPCIDTLKRLLKKYKSHVTLITKPYAYALNRQNGNARLNRECVLVGA
jgi:adenine-specific DNA-methyltransferase